MVNICALVTITQCQNTMSNGHCNDDGVNILEFEVFFFVFFSLLEYNPSLICPMEGIIGAFVSEWCGKAPSAANVTALKVFK